MTIHPRRLRGVAIATVAAAAVLVLPAASPARDTLGACGPDADLLAFSDALNKTTFDGFGVGGLSALALRGGGHARALVDNQGATAARFYDIDLDAHGDLAPAVRAVTTLHRADGTPYTGQDFDGEGLVSLPDGSILASSETEPAIRRFSRDGTELGPLEVPDRFRVAPAGEATGNLTLEGLGLSPGGRDLWAAMEGPLAPDGTTADGRSRLRPRHVRPEGSARRRRPVPGGRRHEPGHAGRSAARQPRGDGDRPRRRRWAARAVPDLRRQLRGGPGHPRL